MLHSDICKLKQPLWGAPRKKMFLKLEDILLLLLLLLLLSLLLLSLSLLLFLIL